MTSKEWGDRLGRYDIRESANEDFWTYCPCHDDTRPSMHVFRVIEGSIRMKCFACGATGEDVCRELGIPESELSGEPMLRRRRRRQPGIRMEQEEEASLRCMACGQTMTIDVWPDFFAGGWNAQGRCRSESGCRIWMTCTVHAGSRREAEQLLRDAARESWRRMEDKTVGADGFEGRMYYVEGFHP